jgi:endonuclease/exonuclease/phosphatase (EEP) superfamily protein YafD
MLRLTLTIGLFLGGLTWLLVLAVVRLGETRRPWPIELLDTFALYAFAPFVALAFAALILRSRSLLGLLLAAALLFGQQYGHYFAPRAALAAADRPTARVLTYNILARNRDAGPLAELVQVARPDVIVLQELSAPYVDDLERRLGRAYPHSALSDVRSGSGGGVFSRLPILEEREFKLSDDGHAVQHVRLRLGDHTISLFNVHLDTPSLRVTNPPGPVPPIVRGYGSPEREEELERLIDATARLDEPFILAGDFNLAAGSRPYRRFPDRWRDAFAERGWGLGHTFPTHYSTWRGRLVVPIPLVRIDYILSSPDLLPAHARVPRIEGSDHLPVLADLQLAIAR